MRPPGSGSGNGATVLEFGPMFEKVRRSRFKLKVGDAVVKRVPVLVVYDHPRRDRAIGFLPHHDRSRLPDVRLRDLDPSAPIPAALVAGTNANGSHIASVRRSFPGRSGSWVGVKALPFVVAGRSAELPDRLAVVEGGPALGANVVGHSDDSTKAITGTGTTAAVAHILGRHGIGIDLSADYLRLAEWRCNDPALRAKVLRVDKPQPVPDGQLDMFGGAA